MRSFDFEILSDEYRRLRIGPHLHGLIWEVVSQRVAGREFILGEAADVFQAFVLEDLLTSDASQLTWIFTTATSSEDVARMLHHRCGRHLTSKRKRTVRDNLWRRSRERLGRPPFKTVDIAHTGSAVHYLWEGTTDEGAQVTPELVRIAAVRARSVERLRTIATERNPRLYGEEALESILKIFLREVRGPASNQDLDEFLRELLTPWEEPALVQGVEADQITKTPSLRALSPEEEQEVESALAEIDASLDDESSAIVLMKILGASDGDVARRHSISRPTAAKRKDQAFAVIRSSMVGLDEHAAAHVVERLVGVLESRDPR